MSVFSSSYSHKEYENKWYKVWEERGWFEAQADSNKETYTILMPPPNVTSRLHMGHGVGYTIQDVMIRRKRMQGFNTCWLPGTDHAGIATQMMVEKSLATEGVTRKELGREAFFQKCVDWKTEHGSVIVDQMRLLGFSCDWSREAYTMNPKLSKAVRAIFVKLYEEGLIYRGERLINWDPVLKTAISDDEVENIETDGGMWTFKYPVEGEADTFVSISTTRPETMFGDTAVAVHPDDDRFQSLIGKQVRLPFVDRLIPIVADEYVKSEFGTGCVKITPAHDFNDFEVGQRHDLESINVMNEDASMNDQCPEGFRGLDRYVARKEVLKQLKDLGLFEKEESTRNAVPYSERSKAAVEPRLSKQWFVKMADLAAPALAAAETKDIKFHPPAWKKTWDHWLGNIQDWCISRQLWWGHRIPIWHCGNCQSTTSGLEDPTQCSSCGSDNLQQDEDVLDTWFSSWLWPVSPFGWPEESPELETFYPSAVLVTAPEIIFLWVARMAMLGLYTKYQVPFKDVYLTATICDKKGRKFSKTLGNGIDPLELIEEHGADAVRYVGMSTAPIGGRVKMDKATFDTGKRFVNKLWKAARFLTGHLDATTELQPLSALSLEMHEKWLLHEFSESVVKIDKYFDSYQINEAVEVLFHLAWRNFCDWGLESSKNALEGENAERRQQSLSLLVYVFEGILRLASPVLPFVTEEIWNNFPAHPDWERKEGLMVSKWPQAIETDARSSEQWKQIQSLIQGIRSVRTQAGVPPKEQLAVSVRCDEVVEKLVTEAAPWIRSLANVGSIEAGSAVTRPQECLVAVGKGYEAYVPVGQWLDLEKEAVRLQSEKKRVAKIVSGLQAKLGNKAFVDRAPEAVIQASREQLENMTEQLRSLEASLAALS